MSKLSFKFFIIILGVALGALLVVSLYLNMSVERHFKDYLFRERRDRIQQLKEILIENYQETESWEESAAILHRFSGINSLYIELENERGDVIYSPNQRGIHSERMGMGPRGSDRGRRSPETEIATEPTEILNLEVEGRLVGRLLWYQIIPASSQTAGIQGEYFTEKVNQAIMIAIALVAVVTVVISYYFSRYLTDPLLEMNRIAARVTEGDFEQTVKVRGNDEVAELAATFNLMVNRLKYLEKIRRESTSDLAHELRTPLTTLNSYLEALQDGVLAPDKETLDDMREELFRLIRLVNRLGELAAAEKKVIHGKRDKISLKQVIRDVADHYRLQAQKKGLIFKLEFDDSNPVIMGDRDSLETIFNNLFSNAVKYTKEGMVKVKAGINDREKVFVRIEDTGIGIPEPDLPYIFERFYRSDKSRSTATGGTGIGLTITRELVEAHGGLIEVESSKVGTTFIITLPKIDD